MSLRFISHLEAEILELKLEVERLKRGYPSEASQEEIELKPTGGFRPRHEIARDVKLAIARRKKVERDKGVSQ